jgi:hypothetical protein
MNTAFKTLSFNEAADEDTIEPPLTDDEGTINNMSKDKETAANDEEASQKGIIYFNMSEAIWNSKFSSLMVHSPTPFGSTTSRPSPVPMVTTSCAPGLDFSPGPNH